MRPSKATPLLLFKTGKMSGKLRTPEITKSSHYNRPPSLNFIILP